MVKTTGGIYLPHLKHQVVAPALNYLKLGGAAAINQIMGTFIVEGYAGGYTYLKQWGNGPALGPQQMEPVTYYDIWRNYLQSSRGLSYVKRLQDIAGSFDLDENNIPKPEILAGNLYFAAAMCRIFYIRFREPLPKANDATGMAQYHKKYYNTILGKADWQNNIDRFQQAINI